MANDTSESEPSPVQFRTIWRLVMISALTAIFLIVGFYVYEYAVRSFFSPELPFETYADKTGLDLGLRDLKEFYGTQEVSYLAYLGGLVPIDRRRFVIVEPQYEFTDGHPHMDFVSWCIVVLQR